MRDLAPFVAISVVALCALFLARACYREFREEDIAVRAYHQRGYQLCLKERSTYECFRQWGEP